MRERERGFTLIELMAVVAIIAILALVAVPAFFREAAKTKAETEVNGMFTEIASKQEQYKLEKNAYLGDADGGDGTTTCPAAVPTAGYNFSTICVTSGTVWETLRIQPTESELNCQYTITAGPSTSTLAVPTGFKNSQGVAADEGTLASGWFSIVATCDADRNGGTNSTFYMSSVDSKIQVQNKGQ